MTSRDRGDHLATSCSRVMQQRKSRPNMEGQLRVMPQSAGDNDRTSVESKPYSAPRGEGPQTAQPNVIAFTRPRAISSLPVQFAPVYKKVEPTAPRSRRSTPAAPIANPSALRPAVPGVGMTKPASLPRPQPAAGPTSWSEEPSTEPAAARKPFSVPPQPQQRGPQPPQMFAPPQAQAPRPPAQPARPLFAAPAPQGFAQQAPAPQFPAQLAPAPQALKPAAQPAPAPPKSASEELTAYAAPMYVDPVPAQAPMMVPSQKWAAFEKLGLVAAKVDPKKLSKHIVTAYRLLGFAILSIIVIVLVGYIVTTAFFYVSDSWIVPAAVSPTDEKVMSLQAQLSERQNQRDKTAAELAQADRAIETQQKFQLGFAKAIKSDLEGRKSALAKMHQLANNAASTRANIHAANNAYASASKRQMQQEWAAGLIDRNQMLSGKFQMAQISTSNLSLAERQAEYETRAADLEAQTRSLEALLDETATDDVMSYDVLQIKQAYEASRLETQKAIETRDSLKAALAREDALVAALKKSAYIRAVADHASVAFVPYGNMHKIEKGTSLYGCSLGMVWCHKVGEVLEVLPGEVQFKHPHRDKTLRGQMVELQLDDGAAAATDDVLFVGGKPLFL
jgi:hypothetical protein